MASIKRWIWTILQIIYFGKIGMNYHQFKRSANYSLMDVTIPYTPRKQQAFIHKELDKKRFSVLCCHRRFGKTVMLINHLIKCCMTNQNHAPRFAYIAPTYSQAKKDSLGLFKILYKRFAANKV